MTSPLSGKKLTVGEFAEIWGEEQKGQWVENRLFYAAFAVLNSLNILTIKNLVFFIEIITICA